MPTPSLPTNESCRDSEFLRLIEKMEEEYNLRGEVEHVPDVDNDFRRAIIQLGGMIITSSWGGTLAVLYPSELQLFTKYHDETIAYAKLVS